jgi:hypothetical protein
VAVKLRTDRTAAQHLEVFLDVGARALGFIVLGAGIALILLYGWMKLEVAGAPIESRGGTIGMRACDVCPAETWWV